MKYLWTTIKVKNMEESLHFYKDLLGLKVKDEKHVSEGFDLAFLDMGESDIELLCSEKMDCTIGSGVTIGFEVESIEEVRTRGQCPAGAPGKRRLRSRQRTVSRRWNEIRHGKGSKRPRRSAC